MRPSFLPRLINGPFDDPGLYIPLTHLHRAMMFDLGDISALSAGDILKTTHIFVSHTHMDHFIGFDHLLRLLLGRSKTIELYGPSGFIANVTGKLEAYSWNLVRNYQEGLRLNVTEIHPEHQLKCSFECRDSFKPSPVQKTPANHAKIYQEPALQIQCAILDHQIPCLAFSLKEHFHVNILKSKLEEMGLAIGPWVGEFKAHLFNSSDPEMLLKIPQNHSRTASRAYRLGDLSEKIARITPGQKVTYVADAGYSPENQKKILNLAKNSDQLFIEAAFLEEDRQVARTKCHLTANQAGTIARIAAVKEMTIFHHSPRYHDRVELLRAEARQAFNGSD